MTDRIRTLTVILDDDFRDDDIRDIVTAVQMVKHVDQVHLGEPVDSRDWVARQAVRSQVRTKLYVAIQGVFE